MEDPVSIPAHREQLPIRPCPVCGTPVEPLRAVAVLLLEDGFRYLCSSSCRDRYRQGERHRQRSDVPRASASTSASSSDPMLRSIRKKKRSKRSTASEWTARARSVAEPDPALPVFPLAIVVIGLVTSSIAVRWSLVAIAALMSVTGAVLALTSSLQTRRDVGYVAWSIAPLGAVLATLSALLSFRAGADARLLLAGSSLAAAMAVLRGWLDATAIVPVSRLVSALRARIPERVRVAVDEADWGLETSEREIDASSLRAGEEVLVSEDDFVPVDGLVRAGEAYVLLHPAARVPARRVAGDYVLAGAKVTDGELRIRATRIGESRALLRPVTFGEGSRDDVARITQITERGAQFAGAMVIVGGAIGLFIAEGGLAAKLSAVACVLLAIPLVSLRRAAAAPFVAAGAAAAERGIIFQNARTLSRAGRTDLVALCTHGVITEGDPEVVEVHPVGVDCPLEEVISLAASVEASAERGGAIGAAIVRYAAKRGLSVGPVRRLTEIEGRGISAIAINGESVLIGSRQLLLDEGVSVAMGDGDAKHAEERGLSVVFVAVERRLRAMLMLRDEDRPGARAAVQRLIDLDVEVLFVSGDHRATVEALAKTLDVDHVKAELTPSERAVEIGRLRESGRVVAAVGRGGFDDATLAGADVPVALGAAGGAERDRAIALTSDDVRDASAALWLANAARREALRAVSVAAGGGLVLVAVAATGLAAPGVVALGALALDLLALPAAPRLIRRIELRLPARG